MRTQGWRVAVAIGLGMMGAIRLPSITLAQMPPSNIVPDATLGAERSQVEFGNPRERITGGAVRGINLFHSFREFNVGEGRGAYFLVPGDAIQNVLARVTGRNTSEILGTLGTLRSVDGQTARSPANLFLINPNGIIFGENARLNLDGSFFATTANAVRFGETGLFNADAPTSDSILNIDPSAFFVCSGQFRCDH